MLSQIYLFIRKCRSALFQFQCFLSTLVSYLGAIGNQSIFIDKNCQFKKSITLLATDGGFISIGCNTCIGDNVQLVAHGGKLTIESDVFIGSGSIIVCRDNIFIGRDTLIAEYVVIRDQDHSVESRPVRSAGFHTSPVHIGRDVWIGCKASILRGASLGDRCVIGAHSLVKSSIPPDTTAVGVPARVVKRSKSDE